MTDILKKKIPKEILKAVEKLKRKPRYLYEKEAKAIVKDILNLELAYQEIEALLERKWATLSCHIFPYHNLHVPRSLHYRYSDDSLRAMVDCFRRSQAYVYPQDKNKLDELQNEVVSAVRSLQQKIGDERGANWNMIRCLVRTLTHADLKRIGRPDIELPLKWSAERKIKDGEIGVLNLWPDVSQEIKNLAFDIKKILDKKNISVAALSARLNVSKKSVIQALEFLKNYCIETEGTTIRVSSKIRGTVEKVAYKDIASAEEAFPGFSPNTKILILSHALLGNKYQQPTILYTIMKIAAEIGVKFAVVVGGIVAGKPKKGTHGEFFILEPEAQIEYVKKIWPKAPFNTYILAGDEELSWKFDQAEAICSLRSDLYYLGAWACTRPLEGTDVNLGFVYPREGAKRTYTLGYRPQRHTRAIIAALFPKIRKEGLKRFPRVIFNGRVLAQGEFNRGAKTVLCPGLIAQTPSLAAAEVVPSIGALIAEFRFDKNGGLIADFDKDGMPQPGGITVTYYDFTPYTLENDYGVFPDYKDCTPHEQTMLKMLKDQPCTEGEISRFLNCSVETVKELFKSLQERGFNVYFSKSTKRIVWQPDLKTEFEPMNLKVKGEIIFGTTSDIHFGSIHQQPSALEMVHKYAANIWKVGFVIDGGDMFDGRNVYQGQSSEVFAETFDEQLEEAVKHYPKQPPTICVGGNHDEKFWKYLIADLSRHFKVHKHPEITANFDIMRQLSRRRPDIDYLGNKNQSQYCTETKVILGPDGKIDKVEQDKSIVMMILHPSGSAGRFPSYKSQKYAESLLEHVLSRVLANIKNLNDLPHIYLLGHWHINAYLRYGGVDIYLLPCFQSQTAYLKSKGLTPDIGSWLVRAGLDENGHILRNTIKYLDLIPWVKEHDY